VVPQTYNAASGRVKGLDLEGIWSPQLGDGRLTLRGAASILDPKYTSFPGAPSYAPLTVNGVQTGGDIVGTINASGRDFIRAARFRRRPEIGESVG
jgi:outer membrane receptor protein involved in Fe transport